jgi:hypothetical protein
MVGRTVGLTDKALEAAMPKYILAIGLGGHSHYVDVGPIQIALANLVVICLMIVVFVLAIILPFPRDKR